MNSLNQPLQLTPPFPQQASKRQSPLATIAKKASAEEKRDIRSPSGIKIQLATQEKASIKATELKATGSKDRWKADPKIALLAIPLLGMGIYAFSHFGNEVVEGAPIVPRAENPQQDSSLTGELTNSSLGSTLALLEKGDPDPEIQKLIEKTRKLPEGYYVHEFNLGRNTNDDYWQVSEAYEKKGKDREARAWYIEAVKKGSLNSMRALKQLNKKEAIPNIEVICGAFDEAYEKEIQKAAKKSSYANWYIGSLYTRRGSKERGDLPKAIEFYSIAAKEGNELSMRDLEQLNKEEAIPDIEAIRAAFNEANSTPLQKVIYRISALIGSLISQEPNQNL